MGAHEGERLDLDHADRLAIKAAIDDPDRGLDWLHRRTGLDVSTLRKMASGKVKTSAHRAKIRSILGVVDIKEPLSDEERELVTLFRRACGRLREQAQGILVQARATGAEIDLIYEEQMRLDDRKAAIRPLVTAPGSSRATRNRAKSG